MSRGKSLWLGLMITGLVTALFLVAMKKGARAHDSAQWIQDGKFKNAAGELCCGKRDCSEISGTDIRITAGGFYIVSIKETVPFAEATPSPTGTYWRCQWGGARKCFFAPPGQT